MLLRCAAKTRQTIHIGKAWLHDKFKWQCNFVPGNMEVLRCNTFRYGKKSCHPLEKSVNESVHHEELNCAEPTKQVPVEDNKGDNLLPNLKVFIDKMQSYGQETDGEVHTSEQSYNESVHCDFDVNEQKLSTNQLDHEGEDLDEQSHYREACLDFQNSNVDVNTIDSEPSCKNKEDDPSVSASKWPEQDESLALWVKWRGRWQAGIKCERADWPLATVKAKPTHGRKNYIVIFFPHTRNYSWADTLLVCSIGEFPQPIAHRSHRVGVRLVEDLTVARRFIIKKLVIGMLNIVDQLPTEVLVETARDVVIWRDFAREASQCKGYTDLGRLLLKLPNMLLQKYIDANWLQYSFHPWVEKCQNALSAESVELLKEELVDSILWNEVNAIRDQVQPPLGPEWKMWKHEAIKCFSTTRPVSGGEDIEQTHNRIEQQSTESPVMTSLQMSRKRPKLVVRRAEPHHSQVENKSSRDNTVEIDLAFYAGQSTEITNNAVVGAFEMELSRQGIASFASPINTVKTWEEVLVDTSNADFQSKDVESTPLNGVIETKALISKIRSHQCIAFIEAKNRRCARWANDGDDYCCVHLASQSAGKSPSADVTPPADAPMCQGTTNLGLRCKHRSLPGSSYCKKHRYRGDGIKPLSSLGSQLKRKHVDLLDETVHTPSRDIVVFREAQRPLFEHPVSVVEKNTSGGTLLQMPEDSIKESETICTEITHCIGAGLEDNSAYCLESPKKHNLYCDKHIPNWLKRARNGKSRIISKEVFLDLLRSCSSPKQKIHLHQACEVFYKLFKSILSLRNQVPKEIQFQWALSEASKDSQVGELLMKLVSREKDRLQKIWNFDVNSNAQVSSSPVNEQALIPIAEENDSDGTLKCKICSEEFNDDQTLGAHWIDNHNKEAQWLFRGYACAICLDSFTNKKVLETHVQERHHAQFVEHCMLIQCIPCGSHFGNSDELWSHVLSVHSEGFRQSKTEKQRHLSVQSQQTFITTNPASTENKSESQSMVRKYICKFCGLKFDLLPDLGRHHQAAHMGPSLLSSRPKKKGLRFYAYKLKSGRLTRPRFKKGIGATSYRLRNKGTLVLKKRPVNSLSAGGINFQSHVTNTASIVRLTETQCSTIAKILSSEAQNTKPRPNNHEILAIARATCCKFSLQRTMEQKYGVLPERFYLKAAKLCCEHNIEVEWHREGFNCPKGCKPPEDESMVPISTLTLNESARYNAPSAIPSQEGWEMDECHYVIDSCHLRRKPLQTTIILCDDISFGQETVPVPCVVDKNLLDSLHTPTYSFGGQVIFMPWESFTYATKPRFDRSFDVNMQLLLGCGCAQSTCSPKTCDHVYLFNCDHENAKDIHGNLMEGRFPYDDKGRLVLEEGCLVYECNHLCKCSRSCPNRVLQNGLQVKLEVFKTEKKGWAVRARETILRGTFICEFVGEVLDVQEANRRRKRHGKENCSYFYDVGEHMYLIGELMEGEIKHMVDAAKYGNVSRFINHSCSPNLASRLVLVESMDFRFAHIGLFAQQDIKPGEELTYSYHCELQPGEGCPCLCGAATCRGRVH